MFTVKWRTPLPSLNQIQLLALWFSYLYIWLSDSFDSRNKVDSVTLEIYNYALFSLCNNWTVARRKTPRRCIVKQHSTPNHINNRPTVKVAQKNAKAMHTENITLDSFRFFLDIHGSPAAFSYSLSAPTVSSDITQVTRRRTIRAVPSIALFRLLKGRFRSRCQASWWKAFPKNDKFVSIKKGEDYSLSKLNCNSNMILMVHRSER